MLPNKNEECLLKFISRINDNNNFLEIISNFGIKLHSSEYNPVYRIIDEINYRDIFKKEIIK